MNRVIKFTILVLLFAFMFSANKAGEAAISISSTGNWSETIDALDLQAGAGSDLIDTYESTADQVSIDIIDPINNWRVGVKKVDTTWHSSFHLYVKRTSDGTGSGSISGGTIYQEVSGTDQSFFSGSDDRSGIQIQSKLSGISVQIPPDIYTTTIYYTVVDI